MTEKKTCVYYPLERATLAIDIAWSTTPKERARCHQTRFRGTFRHDAQTAIWDRVRCDDVGCHYDFDF